LLNKKKLVIKV